MEIAQLITRAVLTVKETDSLREVATRMMERGVGSAVVMTEDKPRGIITDRDALKAVAQGADSDKKAVSEYLTRKMSTVSSSLEVLDAARLMREKNFRHLVVVDEAGVLLGVFSMRDLVVGLLQERTILLQERSTTA